MTFDCIQPQWSAHKDVKVLCTTRLGGVSRAPFDALNLADHVGDETDLVLQNRRLLSAQFNLPAEPSWLNQNHGTRVVNLVTDVSRDADAAMTDCENRIAVVMTADCLPILLSHRHGLEVAAIHAGWRGLADGVIESTLESMASPARQLMAWIGPAISQRHFEVGDEVRERFASNSVSCKKRFEAAGAGHWMCDLPGLAADRLESLGVSDITLSNLCSFELKSRFYSYRRDKVTGRMACLIWINRSP